MDSFYDFSSRYFSLVLAATILPNLIGIVMNLGLWALLHKSINKFTFIPLLFLTNEIAFGIFWKSLILFGTIKPKVSPTAVHPDMTPFLFISISSIIAAIIATSFPQTEKITY
jgi:hypothetical protein